ncbi:hypothetical protein PI172_2359 [Prevotella intermedia]|uniref:Uncharacterized protein n=1 Tax=Prevotella intermedia TaxID=28131 RepID=A0AAD1F8J1_PREIN|nr:hypothetical protein PI172_2359 [Prevotella intermedia]
MLLIAASLYNVAKLLNFSHILKYIALFFNIDIKKVALMVESDLSIEVQCY